MRVFSQINNCQQKQNKKKQNKKQKQKTDKTKRGAPLLGLAKSIYYLCGISRKPHDNVFSDSSRFWCTRKSCRLTGSR